MLEENIKNVTKLDKNFEPIFVDHYLSPDISFNGLCLIKKYFYP